MLSAEATSSVRVITVDGPIAVTSASSACGSSASAAPASEPRPLKVGRIWIGAVGGIETGAIDKVTPAALAPKLTVMLLHAPATAAGNGMVKLTVPVGLGWINLSKETPPVRLSTPPIAAVVASCTVTG